MYLSGQDCVCMLPFSGWESIAQTTFAENNLPNFICSFRHVNKQNLPKKTVFEAPFFVCNFFQHSLSINTARSNATVQKYFDHLIPSCILDLLRHFASTSWEHLWGLLQKISIMSIQGPDRSVTRYFWAALKFLPCNYYDLIKLIPRVLCNFQRCLIIQFLTKNRQEFIGRGHEFFLEMEKIMILLIMP